MTSLEAAFEERQKALRAEAVANRNAAKMRLVVDPMISTSQIQGAFEDFVRFKKDPDLHKHVGPPPSILHANWQMQPSPEWMSKCVGLVFDILSFCPNTKLASTKVKKALKQMVDNKSLHLRHVPGNIDSILDRIDLSVRLVMNMYREAALKPVVKTRILRALSREEGLRVEMALARVVLPVEGTETGAMQDDSQESLSMVVAQPELLPLEDKKTNPVEDAVEPTQQTSLRRLRALSTSTSFETLAPTPQIFDRILKGKSTCSISTGGEDNSKAMSSKPTQGGKDKGTAMPSKPTQEELLKAAMDFAPVQVSQKQPAPKAKAGAKQSKQSKQSTQKKPKKGLPKSKSKKASVKKVHVLKPKGAQVTSKADGNVKSKGKGKGSGKGTPSAAKAEIPCPEYKVEVDPTPEDSYRNLYTSRHYNAAKALALRFGLPREQANAKGREAAKVASAKWAAYKGLPVDVD